MAGLQGGARDPQTGEITAAQLKSYLFANMSARLDAVDLANDDISERPEVFDLDPFVIVPAVADGAKPTKFPVEVTLAAAGAGAQILDNPRRAGRYHRRCCNDMEDWAADRAVRAGRAGPERRNVQGDREAWIGRSAGGDPCHRFERRGRRSDGGDHDLQCELQSRRTWRQPVPTTSTRLASAPRKTQEQKLISLTDNQTRDPGRSHSPRRFGTAWATRNPPRKPKYIGSTPDHR